MGTLYEALLLADPWLHLVCQMLLLCLQPSCVRQTYCSLCDLEAPVTQDIIFSFPVTCADGKWKIKQGLKLDDFSKGKLEATGKELVDEKALALECLKES